MSNIAELVARAFSKNINTNPSPNQSNGWDRRQMFERPPAQHLEDFDEIPQNPYHANSNEQGTVDDNVISGSNVNTKPTTTTTTTQIDGSFLSHMLRVMGMDSSKIGALAINGIIFIAQMVSLLYIQVNNFSLIQFNFHMIKVHKKNFL